MKKSGYVTITGKPNVGKSTFLNMIMQRKVAIVSPKPQTTRNQIKALYHTKNSEIIFIDTPGYHESHNKLDVFLNSQIKGGYKIADVVLLFVDLTRPIDNEDKTIIKNLKEYKIDNIILVLTKFGISNQTTVEKYSKEIKAMVEVKEVITIDSPKAINIDTLIKSIEALIPANNHQTETIIEDENFLISEIIREQIIFNTKQEVPYATSIIVESKNYEEKSKLLTINAVIVVEKQSQKPIIIGHQGEMIKKIGTMARKELLKIYDCKINLKLFVKVQEQWRDDEYFLSTIGYFHKK
ncbi:MAG: GTPase Era [Mycoplasmataceae bacterium]|jgi:GTP-binding protein Era|nr:GTPase Era [Mycoplasmataceae bacterium]